MYCWTVIWHKYNLLSLEDFLRMFLDRQDKLDDISSDFNNQMQPNFKEPQSSKKHFLNFYCYKKISLPVR